ncbi:MAG: hypothetical protein ACK56F_22775, partial [bacterium]
MGRRHGPAECQLGGESRAHRVRHQSKGCRDVGFEGDLLASFDVVDARLSRVTPGISTHTHVAGANTIAIFGGQYDMRQKPKIKDIKQS